MNKILIVFLIMLLVPVIWLMGIKGLNLAETWEYITAKTAKPEGNDHE